MCVCMWERDRESKRQRKRERQREREAERQRQIDRERQREREREFEKQHLRNVWKSIWLKQCLESKARWDAEPQRTLCDMTCLFPFVYLFFLFSYTLLKCRFFKYIRSAHKHTKVSRQLSPHLKPPGKMLFFSSKNVVI
jgi:hypothetical protein